MGSGEPRRKLAAIFSADVKGYSRLMGDDEAATVRTIKAYRQVLTDFIQRNRGRVVDAPGDNLLAEFASVVDAVQAAIDVQDELGRRNADLPDHRRMDFRVGINLGDVIDEEGRLYGDGVNIAARIEGLADPGGICLSAGAFEQVKSKLKVEGKYLGQFAVKNIAEPVRVWALLTDATALARIRAKRERQVQFRRFAFLAAAIACVAIVSVTGWNAFLRPSSLEGEPAEKIARASSDKPSIAVLPFDNMSGIPEQAYFSDGITEDIITNLSKISGIFVISRNSSFLYRGKEVKISDIAKDLGVRYVLEGSVRRGGDRVRITAQLIDGKTDQHVWADSYDRELKDIFSVQDDVTQKVVSELAVVLTSDEYGRLARKHTESFEAYDLFLRARLISMAIGSREKQIKAKELFKRVIELDPNFAGGYAFLSSILSRGIWFEFSTSPIEDMRLSFELAQKAVSVDSTFYFSYLALSSAYLMKREHDKALSTIREAIRILPGDSSIHCYLGFYLHWLGRGEEAVQAVEKAQELNPKYLSGIAPLYLDFMGYAYFTARRYEESVATWKSAIERFGAIIVRKAFLAASYSELGRNQEAGELAKEILKSDPKFSTKSWKIAHMYKNPKDTERLLRALRKAGLK